MSGTELFGAFHQAIAISGNYHTLVGCTVHDVVQSVADSGALCEYNCHPLATPPPSSTHRPTLPDAFGEWTAFGNLVTKNFFYNVHNIFVSPGSNSDMVSTIYLDGLTSGFTVTDNRMDNVARALEINCGRSNTFARNVITNSGGSFGVLSLSPCLSANYCGIPGGLGWASLQAVPWNSSAVWIEAFPELAVIVDDNPCWPAHNAIINNSICGVQYCGWRCNDWNRGGPADIWGCCSSPLSKCEERR